MNPSVRWLPLALLAGAVLVPGCIKAKRNIVVYPDASGKVVVTVGVSKTLASIGELGKEENGSSSVLDPAHITEGSRGILWGESRKFKEEDYSYYEMVGYFEDINEIGLGGTTYKMEKFDDGSYELSFSEANSELTLGDDNPFEDAKSDSQKRMIRGVTRMMLSGMELSFDFKLPGEITEAKGLETEGREARLSIDIDKLLNLLEDPEKAEEALRGKIRARPEGDLSEELAAFRTEMAEAVAKAEEEEAGEEAMPPREEPEEKGEGKRRRVY